MSNWNGSNLRCTQTEQLAETRAYTMMLLIGIWISLTKKPMKPMMAKPTAVAKAIRWNSVFKYNSGCYSTCQILHRLNKNLPFLSGFVHRRTRCAESFANCFSGSTSSVTLSIFCWQARSTRSDECNKNANFSRLQRFHPHKAIRRGVMAVTPASAAVSNNDSQKEH